MKSSIAYAAAFTLVMAASLWLAGCGGSSEEKPPEKNQESTNETGSFYPPGGPIEVEKGDPMGDFTATDINGNRVSLSDYKGKVVLLDFWASWCSPCEREIPNMKEAYEKYRGKGFEIIGVSLDHDQESLNEFLKANDVDWVQIFTGHGWETPIAIHYSVKAIPEPWLIGKDGHLITKEARGEYLEPLVKQALKEESE